MATCDFKFWLLISSPRFLLKYYVRHLNIDQIHFIITKVINSFSVHTFTFRHEVWLPEFPLWVFYRCLNKQMPTIVASLLLKTLYPSYPLDDATSSDKDETQTGSDVNEKDPEPYHFKFLNKSKFNKTEKRWLQIYVGLFYHILKYMANEPTWKTDDSSDQDKATASSPRRRGEQRRG